MVIVHGELLNNQMVNQLSMFNQNTYLKKKTHGFNENIQTTSEHHHVKNG